MMTQLDEAPDALSAADAFRLASEIAARASTQAHSAAARAACQEAARLLDIARHAEDAVTRDASRRKEEP